MKDESPKKKIGFGTFKNVIFLGIAGLGGWWAYNHVIAPALEKGQESSSGSGPQPNLKGMKVNAGKMAIALSKTCISQKDDRFVYTPIITSKKDFRIFVSPVNGHFTGRMLCGGPIKFAEIFKG